jgi:glycosyltransferase involved in cell wall biosynthesis
MRKTYDSEVANWVFEQADAILFNTRAELSSMAHHVPDLDKTHVIPNGLHTDDYDPLPDPAPFREKRGITGPLVLYVGRLASNKRMEMIIQAMPVLMEEEPDLTLVIAGPDDGAGKEWQDLAEAMDLGGSVRFEGFLPEQEKLAAYTAADVFVLPSEWEAYGLVLMEAQACGTPCLVSDRGGPQEVIEDGVSGKVVPYGDEAAWRQALLDLLSDDGLRDRMSKAARTRAMTEFNWPTIIDSIEAVYQDVVDSA